MNALSTRVSEASAGLRRAFSNRDLRRVELALVGSLIGLWAYSIALGVYSYEVGGAALVGLAAFLRIAPAAVVAPFAGVLADRYPRERVMVITDLCRAATLIGAAASIALGLPPAVVFTLAGANALLSTAFEPALRALLPSLARSPDELTAANVATTTIESVGLFLGPALGALLLVVSSPEVVFATTALALLWSASLVARVTAPRHERESDGAVTSFRSQALAGFRAVGSEPRLRLLVGLIGAQTFVDGLLNVLIIVAALELLEMGDAGVGVLTSAVGVGGLVGSIAALTLVGQRRLSSGVLIGLVFWGVPIALIGVWAEPAVAVLMLAVLGVANTFLDVSAYTLLQRAVPDELLARVFGVLESLIIATIALGGILAPVVIAGLGVRGALVATGAFLPLVAAITWSRLRAVDQLSPPAERRLALLRALPLFAPLPAPTLEGLARSLAPVRLSAGETVFRQGDHGDRFYIISQGTVEVFVDGKFVRTQGAGEHFGEIALLRDVPRTATVRVKEDAELFTLERDEFIGAVTGYAPSAEAADAVIAERLARARPGVVSI